jgi:negative regulator of flagellin synthesis FlgM
MAPFSRAESTTMNIDKAVPAPLGGNSQATNSVHPQKGHSGDADRGLQQSTGKDEVELTGISTKLREIESNAAKGPQVDTQRVEAIRAAIDKGEYRIDSEHLASRLVDLETALHKR